MKIHLIAIGGSAMHNLAIALHNKGMMVTGSDDEIFEPSSSRLEKLGLLPIELGWYPEKITADVDAVILGMHARSDNPELLKAQQLGLPIYSYPEYLYEQTKSKTRIVIGGSHGKTTITAMILHVLEHAGIEADYMVGAQLEGFDCMVKLTGTSKMAVLEGDEYLSSPIDRRPKFHLYHPHIAVLSGIAWDHINVFPTFENYLEQFKIFLDKIEKGGSLIYCQTDEHVKKLAENYTGKFEKIPYTAHSSEVQNGITSLTANGKKISLKVFGDHNLQNLGAAKIVCNLVGIGDEDFYAHISSFKGASRRMELINSNHSTSVFKDFAHSPSKLKATTSALKNQFPKKKLVACMELHTFSSLNSNFIEEYKGCMSDVDEAFVYFNPHTIAHKKLDPISTDQVKRAFDSTSLKVLTDSDELKRILLSMDWNNANLLLMTSGNFDGIELNELATEILSEP